MATAATVSEHGGRARRPAPTTHWWRGVVAVAVLLTLLVACASDEQADAPRSGSAVSAVSAVSATDATGRTLTLREPARRVIAFIPSVNEILLALDAGDLIVGRTRYDVQPALADVPSVGGGLDPSTEAIVTLRPDLIFAWPDDDNPRMRPRLERRDIPVFSIGTRDTATVMHAIASVGALVGRAAVADSLMRAIRAKLDDVRRSVRGRDRPTVLYVLPDDPPRVPGPDTFVGQLIGVAGGEHIFPGTGDGWPQVSMEEVVRRQPDLLLIPDGPNGRDGAEGLLRRAGWRELEAVRNGRVRSVPGDVVHRPGPRIGEAAEILRDAIHGGR